MCTWTRSWQGGFNKFRLVCVWIKLENILLQLLLATKTPVDRKEKMWTQIESEMCLQRSKTIAQMCKTKQVSLTWCSGS